MLLDECLDAVPASRLFSGTQCEHAVFNLLGEYLAMTRPLDLSDGSEHEWRGFRENRSPEGPFIDVNSLRCSSLVERIRSTKRRDQLLSLLIPTFRMPRPILPPPLASNIFLLLANRVTYPLFDHRIMALMPNKFRIFSHTSKLCLIGCLRSLILIRIEGI